MDYVSQHSGYLFSLTWYSQRLSQGWPGRVQAARRTSVRPQRMVNHPSGALKKVSSHTRENTLFTLENRLV